MYGMGACVFCGLFGIGIGLRLRRFSRTWRFFQLHGKDDQIDNDDRHGDQRGKGNGVGGTLTVEDDRVDEKHADLIRRHGDGKHDQRHDDGALSFVRLEAVYGVGRKEAEACDREQQANVDDRVIEQIVPNHEQTGGPRAEVRAAKRQNGQQHGDETLLFDDGDHGDSQGEQHGHGGGDATVGPLFCAVKKSLSKRRF